MLVCAAGLWLVRHQRSHRQVILIKKQPSKTQAPSNTRPAAPSEVASQDEAPVKPQPAVWQELEPTDSSDPVPHQAYRLLNGTEDWRLVGASRRGKMHAHQGDYREDAFAIEAVGSWHLVAVSDGAGSYPLSRVGSHLAVETAVTKMKEILSAEPELLPERLPQVLDEALQAAHAAIQLEAKRRELPIKEFSATFLLLVHGVTNQGHIIGSTQVGDGLIAIKYQDGAIEPLAERDSGTYGGETFFLTSKPVEAWLGRSTVHRLEQPPKFLVVMSDGVADDFIPYEKHLAGLFRSLTEVVTYSDRDVAETLLQLIGYEKRGSFDDRTLVMVYQKSQT